MRMLAPVAISSVSLASEQSPDLSYPISNLLLDEPELSFAVESGGYAVSIRPVVTGTINSFVLVGVQSLNTGVVFTNDIPGRFQVR